MRQWHFDLRLMASRFAMLHSCDCDLNFVALRARRPCRRAGGRVAGGSPGLHRSILPQTPDRSAWLGVPIQSNRAANASAAGWPVGEEAAIVASEAASSDELPAVVGESSAPRPADALEIPAAARE